MPNPVIRFPLDITGKNVDNFINGEIHTLSNKLVRVVAPTYGAYFTESLKVYDNRTQRYLTRGTQYICTELLQIPTEAYGKELCYLIVVIDPAVSTEIIIQYQALGGLYTRSGDALVNIYNTVMNDERPVNWVNVLNTPLEFPPTSHLHDIRDVYGFEYLVVALERLRNAVVGSDVPVYESIMDWLAQQLTDMRNAQQSDVTILSQHATLKNNPHTVTKEQVGLGSVDNYASATTTDVNTIFTYPPTATEGVVTTEKFVTLKKLLTFRNGTITLINNALANVTAAISNNGTSTLIVAAEDATAKANAAQAAAIAASAPLTHVGDTGAAHGVVTTATAGFMSAADKTKLNSIATGAQVNEVVSVAGKTGAVLLTSSDVGLGSVDNTADTTKPVSTAQQTALNLKANLASPTLTGTPLAPTAVTGTNTTQIATTAFVNAEIASDAAPIAHVGDTGSAHGVVTTSVNGFMSTADKVKLNGIATGAQVNTVTSVAGRTGAVVLAKTDVGLANVDNTADSAKSVSFATTAGTVSGTAPLGEAKVLVSGVMASNDSFGIKVSDNGTDLGYVELYTGDNGSEPIYVRQYTTGVLTHSSTLLDTSGNTVLGGTITATNLSGTNTGDQGPVFGRLKSDGVSYGSYGSVSISGLTNGYAGIAFNDVGGCLMDNGTTIGYYRSNNAWLWNCDNSGNFNAIGNLSAYSDERLKINWKPLDIDFIEKWSKVKSGVYERVDTKAIQAGLSAQSVQKILPEVITEQNSGLLSLNYGAAAAVATVELAKHSLSNTERIKTITNTIEYLLNTIDNMLRTNQNLEKRIEELEKK